MYCGALFCAYVCVWHECVCVCYVGQVARHLCGAGHEVHIVTVAPEYVFRRDIPSPKLHIRKVRMSFPCIQTNPINFSSLPLSLWDFSLQPGIMHRWWRKSGVSIQQEVFASVFMCLSVSISLTCVRMKILGFWPLWRLSNNHVGLITHATDLSLCFSFIILHNWIIRV